jgi:hypothetical protein
MIDQFLEKTSRCRLRTTSNVKILQCKQLNFMMHTLGLVIFASPPAPLRREGRNEFGVILFT